MIFYPILAKMLGLGDHAAGVFLGGTIHDVAQVIGAGYSISQKAGDTATIVKLLRVSLLLPAKFTYRQTAHRHGQRNQAVAELAQQAW